MKKFLSSLLLALCFGVAFTPAHADDACKNLFDASLMRIVLGSGITHSIDSVNKTILLNGSGSVGSNAYSYNISIPEQITISVTVKSGSFTPHVAGSVGIRFFDANNKIVADVGSGYNSTETTFGPGTKFTRTYSGIDATKVALVGPTNVEFNNCVLEIQIEKGALATAYQPYNPLCATCDGTVVSYETVAAADVPAGVQNGTPSPTNPIEPVFYTQGDMVLRRIGDYADSYDATTGKITRRVGVKVLDGTENWSKSSSWPGTFLMSNGDAKASSGGICTHFIWNSQPTSNGVFAIGSMYNFRVDSIGTVTDFKQWLAEQYAAGTPVTVWYPLATPVEEDWAASYCHHPIKIATTAYNNNAFSSVQTALNTAVDTIKTVVANTILQTTAVQQIASDKQTRPSSGCPTGKTCLLVEDMNGEPHWYEIIEEYIPPLPAGYTRLSYIESTGTQYIDTGYTFNTEHKLILNVKPSSGSLQWFFGANYTSGEVIIGKRSNMYFGGSIGSGENVFPTSKYYNIIMDTNKTNTSLIVDNNVVFTGSKTFNPRNILLFAYVANVEGTTITKVSIQISNFRVYQKNGTLVQNLVPVRRDSDNKIGMYDTVTNTFFTNAGTGTFTAGPAVQ